MTDDEIATAVAARLAAEEAAGVPPGLSDEAAAALAVIVADAARGRRRAPTPRSLVSPGDDHDAEVRHGSA